MIGIFDSGVGGMTVARAIEQLLPDYPLIYFGDIAHTPYGPKSPETITRYALNNTDFLLENGATLIVIACNSASSVATETLREKLDIPVIEVISPAVAGSVARTKNGRIGIIGTRATVKSGIYEKKIAALNQGFKTYAQACPLLVPLVEEGWTDKQETKMIVRRYLRPLKDKQIDTLVLGCTHYPLVKKLIQHRIGKRVELIDSSIETARYVKNYLDKHPDIVVQNKNSSASHRYYVSDLTESVQSVANRIFNRTIDLIRT